MNKTVFLVSTGRTATRFLAETLDRVPNVYARHEPSPTMNKAGSRYWRWRQGSFQHNQYRQYLPLDLFYRYKFWLSRTFEMKRIMSQVYLEANHYLVAMLPEIRRAFPDCTIVQIVRHPWEFIHSALNFGMFLRVDDDPQRDKFFRHLDFEEDANGGEIPGPFRRAHRWWLERNKLIQQSEPDMVLTFDSIVEEPHYGYRQLLDCVGHAERSLDRTVFQQKINTSPSLLPPPDSWDSRWKSLTQPSLDVYEKQYAHPTHDQPMGVNPDAGSD